MLPPAHRLRRADDFQVTVRRGDRAGGRTVVVHQLVDPAESFRLVGFVVGRSVGNSVVRHRVSRRLRAQMMPHLGGLPVGSRTVVRALAPAAGSSSHQLADEIGRLLDRVGSRRQRSASGGVRP